MQTRGGLCIRHSILLPWHSMHCKPMLRLQSREPWPRGGSGRRSGPWRRAGCGGVGAAAVVCRSNVANAAGAAVVGSLAAAPLSAVLHILLPLTPAVLSPSWELDSDALALCCAGLGLAVARFPAALRWQLVALAALLRTASHLHASAGCTAPPLQCGPPLGYLDAAMLSDATATGVLSLSAFAAVAAALGALEAREQSADS